MINRSAIRSMANAASYSRGQDIYYQNKVQDLTVTNKDGKDRLEAVVRGSRQNQYQVRLNVDNANHSVTASYCDCPAFYSYSGICKHCVAVLLSYNDYLSVQHTMGVKAPQKIRSGSGVQFGAGYQAASLAQKEITTPEMKNLLTRQTAKRTFCVMHKDYMGKVWLEPSLIFDGNKSSLEFRIGVTQMYVIKDIFEFARVMEHSESFRYGKKLDILHTMEVFQEEVKPLVAFLMNWAADNKPRFLQANYAGMAYGATVKIRQIPLSPGDVEELSQVLPGNCLRANIVGVEDEWHVQSGRPDIVVKITGKERGVYLETEFAPMIKGKHYYLFFSQSTIYKTPKEELLPIAEYLDYIYSVPSRSVFIQKRDIPLFCRELLPGLEQICECTMENFSQTDYGVKEASFEIYLDMPQRDYITCELYALYGEKKNSVFGSGMEDSERDYVREIEVRERITPFFNAYDELQKQMVLAEDEKKLYVLLTEGIALMQEQGEVFISDSLKRMKVVQPPKVSVGVSLAGELLELSLTAGNMSMEELVDLLNSYKRKKKFHRMKNGDFINIQGDSIEGMAVLKENLKLSDTQLRTGTAALPKYRALYLDEELKEWSVLSASRDKMFRALVRNMKTVEDNDFEIPDSMQNVLREYQKRGYLWVKTLHNNGFGGILADDMGLGKTLQVIAFLESEFEEAGEEQKRCLIVTPASLVFNWQSEITRFAPEIPSAVVVGSADERKNIIQNAAKQVVFLTSYDLLKRDADLYRGMQFFCQVIDEAQYIKNHNTQAARAVKSIEAGFRLALTGTPVENRLSELWSIFDYLMPDFLYSYARFRKDMELPIIQNGDKEAAARLQKMIRPFVLRRLKKDVLTDLPDKLEENLVAVLEGEQQKLYDAHVKRMQIMLSNQSEEEFQHSKIQILAELTKLRQLCCDPSLIYENYAGGNAKMELCMDLLRNAVNGGHKVLLFSQFTSMLDNLIKRMEEDDISHYLLTGATGKEKRRELVEAFNQDDTSVFCISLKAGGTGLNLTAADIVIHFDPWWNLAVQNQATDRAHRIGQKNVVNVYKMIVKDTIEENIVRLQAQKSMLADSILGGEGLDSASFNREELLELLGGA